MVIRKLYESASCHAPNLIPQIPNDAREHKVVDRFCRPFERTELAFENQRLAHQIEFWQPLQRLWRGALQGNLAHQKTPTPLGPPTLGIGLR